MDDVNRGLRCCCGYGERDEKKNHDSERHV